MEKNKTIKIFLASSNELSAERREFGNFIRSLDTIYESRGMRLKVFEWEDGDASITDRRTQDEYNEKIRESDMFVAMFYKEGGKFTIEEFDVAMDEYRKKGFPKVYVYCKNLNENERKREKSELKAFKARLNEKGNERFWVNYSNQDSLQLHFVQQFLKVENGLNSLKLDGDKVMLEGIAVAELAKLPFAAGNKNYKEMKEELDGLPEEIELARQSSNEHPDSEKHRNSLQRKLNRKNQLIEEFAQLQKTLFETSQRIAGMQREQLSDKLRRAAEAFEAGNMERANTLLDEIEREAETHYANLNQDRKLVHQDIEAFLLRAKTRMTEVNTPIEERIKQVLDIYAKADQWAKESSFPNDKYEGLLDDYAKFLYDYGLYKEAELVHLRLIVLREELYDEEHADTATSYNNIGVVYFSQGDYTKALEYHKKALDIYERVLGPDHPNTATSYNNIGEVYRNQGDYAKALEYDGKALDIVERVLGSDHPNTAHTYNNIGLVYYEQGDYLKALENFEKALNIWKQVLSPDHPNIALSYNNIGMICQNKGDYNKALENFEKALDIWKKVLGSDHPNIAFLYNNIGMICQSKGDYHKALENFKKALDIWKQVLGSDHPNIAFSYNNIGLVYYEQGDYPKALENFEKALDIWKQVSPDHPNIALSYNNIGLVYCEKGDYPKALENYEKALDIWKQVSPDHPNIALSYNNIGEVYCEKGDYPKALEYAKKALDIYERVLGPDHLYTAQSYNNIGWVYAEHGDYAKALKYFKKALDILERKLGSDHPKTATSYNNIGWIYRDQGNYSKALEYYRKALDIRERVLGPNHPHTKDVKIGIEICHKKMLG